MNIKSCTRCCALALLLPSLPSGAAQLQVELEIPKIDTVEYHRPYLAVWVEDEKNQQVTQIALWLEQEKWHRDLRSWWRRGGNRLALPVDGVSGATRKPGRYSLSHNVNLPVGKYWLNIESVREVGGREHIRIPFDWSLQQLQLSEQGSTELGQVTFTILPEPKQ